MDGDNRNLKQSDLELALLIAHKIKDNLSIHEVEEALSIMGKIKDMRKGYMLVMPDARRKGKSLFIHGPLIKVITH